MLGQTIIIPTSARFTKSDWFGLTPNGDPLLMRDIGSQEVYALDFEEP
jgi:hypothetical protein